MSRDPIRLERAITELMAIRGFNRVNSNKQLAETWNKVATPIIGPVAERTKATGIRNGILQVSVGSSALLGELKSYHHLQLLTDLQKAEPKIRDIKYRLNSNMKSA